MGGGRGVVMNPQGPAMRLAFVFLPGRLARLHGTTPGEFPTEFFYGALELSRQGHAVETLEAQAAEHPGFPERLAHQFLSPGWLPPKTDVGTLAAVRRLLPRLRQAEVVVATTSGIAFSIAFWFAVLRCRVPLVAIHASILNYQLTRWHRAWGRFGLRRMHTQLFGPGELSGMQETYDAPADHIEVNLFGVDTNFWQPAATATHNYVLSIGNDALRDYTTLLAVARGSPRRFIIVTRRPLPEPLPSNVELFRGSWSEGPVDDRRLRELYQDATCIVVPLKPTLQPSGQSVTLQAMACGKPVILTDTAGCWDRAHLAHGRELLFAPPTDVAALHTAIERVFTEPELGSAMGTAGRAYVQGHADIRQFAARLEALCQRSIATGRF